MLKVPRSHPRYQSLYYRSLLSQGVNAGVTSIEGLIAHGRGEAFDYLLEEKTHPFAYRAILASAAMLIMAKLPVLSVNGNTAVLVPRELVGLSKLLAAKLEVNLFHASKKRQRLIVNHLKEYGAKEVLVPYKERIPGIDSNRGLVNKKGQLIADVVFVPLEDGDRTKALIAMGKKVITVDLNPLSRTARTASITIVDNIIRAMPAIIQLVKQLKKKDKSSLVKIISAYDNQQILLQAERAMRGNVVLRCKGKFTPGV